MAKTRRGQQQPMRRGTGRQPGEALSAALRGRAAPGLASGVMDQQRALAKNAGKLSDALGVLPGIGGFPAPRAMPQPDPRMQQRRRRGVEDPPARRAPVKSSGETMARPKSLADAISAPAPRLGAAAKPRAKGPAPRVYTTTGELNQTGNVRNGLAYSTFTVPGRDGEYHEYVDKKTGKKTVVHVPGKK